MSTIRCKRCGEEREPLAAAPYNSPLGQLILVHTCQNCFTEWKKFSLMVLNEYRLKPFLPQDRAVLEKHMKEFLKLEETVAKAPSASPVSLNKEKIIERLEQIFDPEIPVNIYDLGLIYNIAIDAERVSIRMTLTSQHCPAAQSLPATVKEVLSRTPGVKEVTVAVVWDPPWSKALISEAGRKILGL